MKMFKASLTCSAVLLLLAASGCDTAAPNEDVDASASEDVALSVSNLISEDTGGLLDQVGDIFEMATGDDIETAGKTTDPAERVYDDATGTWTISFTREHGSPDNLPYATVNRVYELRFLNEGGQPQRFFVTEGDTAQSIHLTIVEGNGSLETEHLSAERTNIAGAFVATGVDTDEVTVNGTYNGDTFAGDPQAGILVMR